VGGAGPFFRSSEACRAASRLSQAAVAAYSSFGQPVWRYLGPQTKVLFEAVDVDGGMLRFRPPGELRPVVREDLFVDYGPALDLSKVPVPILWAPGIFNMAPVVWRLGLTASVPFRYAPMEQGLERIQARFRQIFPSTGWHGRLLFEGEEVPPPVPSAGAIVMFSGGLDSVHTTYRHMDERPTLVRMISAAMAPALQAATVEQGAEFAAQHGLGFVSVVSNINEFLKPGRLLFPDIIRRRKPWWVGVQFGIGTPSVAAPVAYLRGVGRVYLASSLSESFGADRPFASQPSIDDHVAWPGARVIHDSFELTRQQKINDLVRRCSEGMPKPGLRVCNFPVGDRLNCGICEKCLRTMAGLIAEGESPKDWGFDADRSEAIQRIKLAFEGEKLWIFDDSIYYWKDVHRAAASSANCPPDFVHWLGALDFEPLYRRSRRKRWMRGMAFKLVPGAIRTATRPLVEAIYPRARRKPML
jgi:hypothetical protein